MSDTIMDRLVAVEKQVEETQQAIVRGDGSMNERHRMFPQAKDIGTNTGHASFDNLRRLVVDLRSSLEKQGASDNAA